MGNCCVYSSTPFPSQANIDCLNEQSNRFIEPEAQPKKDENLSFNIDRVKEQCDVFHPEQEIPFDDIREFESKIPTNININPFLYNDCDLEKTSKSCELKKRIYFNKLNISSNEFSRILVISSVLEIICSLKEFMYFLSKNTLKYSSRIIKKLVQVSDDMFCNKLFRDDCDSIVNYFISDFEEKIDPLQITFVILRKLNNNEGLIFDKIPQFYKDNHYDITTEELNKLKNDFKNGFIDNYFSQAFCIASLSVFKHCCKYENCRKIYATVNFDNDSFLTVFLNEKTSFKSYIFNKYSFKQISFRCHECKRLTEDFKIREAAIFVNIPKFLIIKIKSERIIIKNDKKIIEYNNCEDMSLMEIESLKLGNKLFLLIGIVCNTSDPNNYYSIIRRDGLWLNNFDFTELKKDDNSIIKGVDLLFYEKAREIF